MKDITEVLLTVIFLILMALTILGYFNYIPSLIQQNNALSISLEQMSKRIKVLESDKTMEKITALKAETRDLRNQIYYLRILLNQTSRKITDSTNKEVKQEIRKEERKAETASGNRGYLKRTNKPTQ